MSGPSLLPGTSRFLSSAVRNGKGARAESSGRSGIADVSLNIKKLTDDTLVAKGLAWMAGAVFRHPRWFLFPQLILFGLCLFYTIKHLEFDTSRDNLVGANKGYHQNYLRFKKEFPTQDDLVVVVESEDPAK